MTEGRAAIGEKYVRAIAMAKVLFLEPVEYVKAIECLKFLLKTVRNIK